MYHKFYRSSLTSFSNTYPHLQVSWRRGDASSRQADSIDLLDSDAIDHGVLMPLFVNVWSINAVLIQSGIYFQCLN